MNGFFLANSWGLLALLGIPAVLLIHLLRRKSREVVVSTLFLIERALPSSEGGRRIRRLRNSVPLWLQLLAVCALTWLLCQPRWIDQTSTQTVVAVFDSSASMSAFRADTLKAAEEELGRLNSVSATTRWILLRSDGSRIAAGSNLQEVLADLGREWQPVLGTHDVEEALRLARTLAGEKGSIIYFSDRVPGQMAGVAWRATGQPIENVGFLGAEAQNRQWSALVKNFGTQEAEVKWRIAGQENWQTLKLAAGGLTEVSGEFPEGADRLTLELAGDQFAFDDKLPIIKPSPKVLAISIASSESFKHLFEQLVRLAEPAIPLPSGRVDVSMVTASPLTPQAVPGSAVIFVEDADAPQKPMQGMIVAENHPLMENLNWQGLIARETFGLPFGENDTALLWQGSRPLIFLRNEGGSSQLIFNFDIRQSNAARLPAFALLVHRFFNSLREGKIAYEAVNAEARQTFSVAGVGPVKAPAEPGFFSAKGSDEVVLFDGAAQFSDTRESDFSGASSARSDDGTVEAIRQNHEQGEFLEPLWMFLLAGLMFWNWYLTGAPRRSPRTA